MALLDFIGSIFGSSVNAIGGYYSNKMQAKENEKNRQWQEEMWNKQNEYNSPTSVLARYSDAGIQVNPNYLVTGSYDGGLASSVGSPATDNSYKNPMQGVDTIAAYTALKNMRNQTEIKDSTVETNKTQQEKNVADTKKANADELVALENAKNIASDTQSKDLNNLLTASTLQTSIEMAKEQLVAQRKANKISEAEYQNKLKEFEILLQRLEEAKYEVKRAEEAVHTQEAETGYLQAKTVTEGTQQELNRALKTKAGADTIQAMKQGRYFDALRETEDYTRLSREAKNWAEVEQIRSETGLNEMTAKKLLIDGVLAYNEDRRKEYITYVRDKYGANVGVIIQNKVDAITKRVNGFFKPKYNVEW